MMNKYAALLIGLLATNIYYVHADWVDELALDLTEKSYWDKAFITSKLQDQIAHDRACLSELKKAQKELRKDHKAHCARLGIARDIEAARLDREFHEQVLKAINAFDQDQSPLRVNQRAEIMKIAREITALNAHIKVLAEEQGDKLDKLEEAKLELFIKKTQIKDMLGLYQ